MLTPLTLSFVGVGVKAVVARSFAFIYGRNQPSLGLLGITISDEGFFEAAREGQDVIIDILGRTTQVGGVGGEGGQIFPFRLSEMEYNLTVNNGMIESYRKFGKTIWEEFTKSEQQKTKKSVAKALAEVEEEDEDEDEDGRQNTRLEW